LKILITGIAGFAGSNLAQELKNNFNNLQIFGLDNFSRKGSELNIRKLNKIEVDLVRGDIRSASDIDNLPQVDWVIDCAANPSVLAGVSHETSSKQLMEHNLIGTINILEYCKKTKAGLVLISTSRVYSALELANLPVNSLNNSFQLESCNTNGCTKKGISESFPTTSPISLYGASKLASEQLILEYSYSFGFPIWINRCGVLAGAGQFGKADQGVFSFWLHSFKEKQRLKYYGFGGTGYQVRDAFHPFDLAQLVVQQVSNPNKDAPKILNLGGGIGNSISLRNLSDWCENRFGVNIVESSNEKRNLDAPWIVMDSSLAKKSWNWSPKIKVEEILDEIANHADKNPNWLKITN
jgi:CDP-paratose 2-epimerase